MTPERKVKQKVRTMLESVDAYYVMPVTGGYGNSGAPDFLVCLAGKFVGIECKAGGRLPTALQEKNLAAIMRAGGDALVVSDNNLESLQEYLNEQVK